MHPTMLLVAALAVACSSSGSAIVMTKTAGPAGEPSAEDDFPGQETPGDDEEPEGEDESDPPAEEAEEETPDRAEWTVFVYLNGDNNLEQAALIDMNEMEEVGSTDEVHLLVQLDRSTRYTREDGNWSGARRYRAEQDADSDSITSPVLEDLGSVDSGIPETYVDFFRWGIENFPAERYAFIIWDHGWGWDMTAGAARKGVSEDDQTGNWLSVAGGDLDQILREATEMTGEKLALVGMDACLMANWEVATVVAPYAEIYVASQATESLDGWAYHTAYADLVADPEMDAAELGTVFAQRFIETLDATQSVVDLGALDAVNSAIDSLALEIMDAEDPREAIIDAANAAQTFDGDVPDRDLGDLSLLLSEDTRSAGVSDAAAVALDELQTAVVANYTYGSWVRHATGLSIYLPTRHGPDSAYAGASWASLTHWDEMLQAIER